MDKTFDCAGWATKYDIVCTDGNAISANAFAHCDGERVPLVYNHNHTDSNQILGHADLEWRKEGMYAYCTFNDTENGVNAKKSVQHGDLSAFSIHAKVERRQGNLVTQGRINEVSLVIRGANPGATIEEVAHNDEDESEMWMSFAHSDEGETLEACFGCWPIVVHSDESEDLDDSISQADDSEENEIAKIYATFTEKQKDALAAVIGTILDATDSVEQSDYFEDVVEQADDSEGSDSIASILKTLNPAQQKVAMLYIIMATAETEKDTDTVSQSIDEEEENYMKTNVFDQTTSESTDVISHADMYNEAHKAVIDGRFNTFKEAVMAVAASHKNAGDTLAHSIDPSQVSTLFEDPHLIGPNAPEKITRDMTWAEHVLSGVNKVPYQRLRVRFADMRNLDLAKGYKTGDEKTPINDYELIHRTVDPQTVYVTDTLDRDNIIDVEGFDLVTYEYGNLQMIMKETLARAIMIGDDRTLSDPYKIHSSHITPIWGDGSVFAIYKDLDMAKAKADLQGTNTAANFGDAYVFTKAFRNAVLEAREEYRGSGSLEMYITPRALSTMLESTDLNGRDMYDMAKLPGAFNVSNIITVEQFAGTGNAGITRTTADGKTKKLIAIIVNLRDYDLGNVKKGDLTRFEDFDIKHNQYTYLLEGRYSGMLVKPFSAIIIEEDVTVSG